MLFVFRNIIDQKVIQIQNEASNEGTDNEILIKNTRKQLFDGTIDYCVNRIAEDRQMQKEYPPDFTMQIMFDMAQDNGICSTKQEFETIRKEFEFIKLNIPILWKVLQNYPAVFQSYMRLDAGLIKQFIEFDINSISQHHRAIALQYLNNDQTKLIQIIKLSETHPRESEKIYSHIYDIYVELTHRMSSSSDLGVNKYQVDYDSEKSKAVVSKRITRLIDVFINTPDQTDEILNKQKDYQIDVIRDGSHFAGIKNKDQYTINELNESFPSFQTNIFNGGELIKSSDRKDMEDADNYLQPNEFNKGNYEMIVENFKKTYGKNKPGILDAIIDKIPKNLSNPNVQCLLVKNNDGLPMGICMLEKIDKDHYRGSTFYVEEEFQRGFNIGMHIDQYVRNLVPKGAKYEASVVATNTAAYRHINSGVVGTGITPLGSNDFEIVMDMKPKYKLKTRSDGFSENRIKQIYENGENIENVKILLVNTSNYNYTVELNKLFKKGYVLSRFFYDQGQDQGKTYLVLEKTDK